MVSTTGQQEHNENAEQLGGTNFVATKRGCVSAFDVACDVDAYEAARMSHQKAEDLTVAEQGRQVRMGNLDPSQVTSNRAFAAVAQKRGDDAKAESKAKAQADALFLAMIDQIRDLENRIAAKYGENFAEDMIEDLHQEGKISDEDRDRIMAIEDPEERRQAIADLIQEKLESGEITLVDLKDYEWAQEWLSLHKERIDLVNGQAHDLINGVLDYKDVQQEIIDRAKEILFDRGENPNSIEPKHITDQSGNSLVVGGINTNVDF